MVKAFFVANKYSVNNLLLKDPLPPPYILLSFFYLRSWKEDTEELLLRLKRKVRSLILDSGAFTLMESKNKPGLLEVEKYFFDYLRFIFKYGKFFDFYFELDLPFIYGQKKIDEWHNTAKEYGVNLVRVYHNTQPLSVLDRYLNEDHWIIGLPLQREFGKVKHEITEYIYKHGKVIHGLAYTPQQIDKLKLPGLYSVDSARVFSGAATASIGSISFRGRGVSSFTFTFINYLRWLEYVRRCENVKTY